MKKFKVLRFSQKISLAFFPQIPYNIPPNKSIQTLINTGDLNHEEIHPSFPNYQIPHLPNHSITHFPDYPITPLPDRRDRRQIHAIPRHTGRENCIHV